MRIFYLAMMSLTIGACTKNHDDVQPPRLSSDTLGTWTIKGRTFTALSYRRMTNTVTWYNVKDMFFGTEPDVNELTLSFTEKMPTIPGTYEVGSVLSAGPLVNKNFCRIIKAGVGTDLYNPEYFTTPSTYTIPWGNATVTVEDGKHFITIAPIKIYEIDPGSRVIDSTSVSVLNLEY